MKKSIFFIATLSIIFNAYGENQNQQQTAGNVTAPKNIVASFYPIAFMAEKIVGGNGKVTNLSGSVDVHAYQLSPQDLVKLNQADLVVFQGAKLEPWTDSVIPELKDKGIMTLEVSEHLKLTKFEENHDDHKEHHDDHKSHEGEHKDKHHDGHAGHHDSQDHHKDEHAHAKHEKKHDAHTGDSHDKHNHDEHNHGEYDPHTWLDPILAQNMVDEILEAIIKIDAKNEAFYRANAIALKDSFSKLDKAYQTGLSNCVNQEMIISHDAYTYLANRYGFEFHAIAGLSPKDVPSAKILAELSKQAKHGITHVLIEENKVRRFADTLASETGLKTLSINPLGRGTLDPKKDFIDVMYDNLNSFKEALSCKS